MEAGERNPGGGAVNLVPIAAHQTPLPVPPLPTLSANHGLAIDMGGNTTHLQHPSHQQGGFIVPRPIFQPALPEMGNPHPVLHNPSTRTAPFPIEQVRPKVPPIAFPEDPRPPLKSESLEGINMAVISEVLNEAMLALDVTWVVVGDWMIVLRQESDFCMDEFEPHWAVTFLLHVKSGEYRHRIFDRSVCKGRVTSADLLKEALWESFLNVRPCQGLAMPAVETSGQTIVPIGAEIVKFPYNRAIASDCLFFYKPEKESKTHPGQCEACHQLESKGALIPEVVLEELNEECDIKTPKKRGRRLPGKTKKSRKKSAEEEEFLDDAFPYDSNEDDEYVPDFEAAEEEEEHEAEVKEEDEDESGEEGEDRPKRKYSRRQRSIKSSLDSDDEASKTSMKSSMEDYDGEGALPCSHCDKLFRDKTSLKRHLRFVNRMHVYKCHGCEYECKTLNSLLDHIRTEHKDKMHEFEVFFREDDEAKGMKEPKKCGICDMIFNGHNLLHRHRNQSHFLGDYRCDQCNAPQLTKYDLQLHLSKEHLQPLEKILPETHGLEPLRLDDGRIKYKRVSFTCEVCVQPFTFDSSCDNHKRKEHLWGTFSCPPCGVDCHFAKDMVSHVRNFHLQDDPDVKCPLCQSEVVQDKFIAHYETCVEASFKAKSKLASTRSKIHYQKNKERRKRPTTPTFYQCDECGKSFKSKVIFKGHLHSHRGTEKYRCDECDYTTHFKAVMTDHRKMHLRAKGYTNGNSELVLYQTCHICGKQFAQMQGLKKHIEGFHEGIKKERPCEECGKVFNSSGAYYHHKRKVHGFVSNRTRCGKQKF